MRLGFAFGTDRATGVAIDHGRVVWEQEVALDAHASIEDAILALCTDVPRASWSKRLARVHLGPGAAAVKHLEGVPLLPTARLYEDMVRAQPSRFFLASERERFISCATVSPEAMW